MIGRWNDQSFTRMAVTNDYSQTICATVEGKETRSSNELDSYVDIYLLRKWFQCYLQLNHFYFNCSFATSRNEQITPFMSTTTEGRWCIVLIQDSAYRSQQTHKRSKSHSIPFFIQEDALLSSTIYYCPYTTQASMPSVVYDDLQWT